MRARYKRLIPALLGSAFFLLFGAAAEARHVAPLAPSFAPEKAKEIVVRFHNAIAAGLKEGNAPAIAADKVRAKAPKACRSKSCAKRARATLGVEHVVTSRIETAGKNYTIELKLHPGSASVKGRCDICTLMEALSTTRKLAARLGKENSRVFAPAAKVTPKAVTPTLPRAVVEPTPEAPKPVPPAPKPDEKTSRKAWPLWPTLVAAGVGVVGLAAGLPLLSMDGDYTGCRGTPLPNGANCEDRYSTSGGGWVLTTMGVAGLATSGVLLYLYLSSRSEQKDATTANSLPWNQLSFAPTRDGFLVSTGGVF